MASSTLPRRPPTQRAGAERRGVERCHRFPACRAALEMATKHFQVPLGGSWRAQTPVRPKQVGQLNVILRSYAKGWAYGVPGAAKQATGLVATWMMPLGRMVTSLGLRTQVRMFAEPVLAVILQPGASRLGRRTVSRWSQGWFTLLAAGQGGSTGGAGGC